MGILPALREAAIEIDALAFVDGEGRRVGGIPMRVLQGSGARPDVEIFRSDLASILYDASRSDAEYVFDDSIVALEQGPDGVVANFERGAARRFDLVVGADGLHSAVRRIVFGPEHEFVEHIGMYVATVALGGASDERRVITMYNAPGRAVAIHPARGRAVAAFMFRSPPVAELDLHDSAQHAALLARTYAADRWRVPELLARARETDDLYFDSVSKVALPEWSRGDVVLVGDAASCVSLFGDGSSSAIVGARTLAAALAAHPADPRVALRRYEAEHRRVVEPRLRGVDIGASLIVPATGWGLAARNAVSRAWPIAETAIRFGRTLGGLPPLRQDGSPARTR
jgi:2-polyprenyl-6-methoxyphenol hydroxylase-like FAD-dependent oxidoreductase